jgi:menaquinone-dependent protoporphyrinogen oxidase
MHLLLIYATLDGHTLTICQRLKGWIEAQGHTVTLLPIEQADDVRIQDFDQLVLGASIHYGKHRPEVLAFARQQAEVLNRMRSAFFSVNIVARKPLKNQPDTNPYLRKFLKQVPWKPTALDVFAGRLDYPRLGPVDRLMIRLIMWLTHGPTDPTAVVEFTDWQRVQRFAQRVCAM